MLELIAKETGLNPKYVSNVITLLEEGATIPFIARYRKEMTGEMDEVQIAQVQMTKTKHDMIARRKETMLKTIEDQGALTPELKAKIESTYDLVALDDIYLPYKPKRKTRATDAKEKGLEPLAKIILLQQERNLDDRTNEFINEKVKNAEEALKGARDIIAEWINENEQVRTRIRNMFSREAVVRSAVVRTKEEEGIKYKDYYEWQEPLQRAPSHRILALLRGEDEGFLRVYIEIDPEKAHDAISGIMVKSNNACSRQMEQAIEESYRRLIQPSMETEFRNAAKDKADVEAIRVFAENLRQLLLAAPLGQKKILAIDPGFRTGCKVVCLDAQGNLLHNETIYPHPPQNEQAMAMKKITSLVESYDIDAIAIGNGTAGRETEQFISRMKFSHDVKVFVVNEAGASIYSASSVAREEFPDYDVTVRGSVSIGRRLMDPLAELVKIDPKSIGVGQYQHDVDQTLLKQELDRVVESCVNAVGVELNTASKHLLAYVSGLGESIAEKIVQYRKENGPFRTREALKKVPRLGEKAFEQCAGFLRIADSPNPLDNSAVHPEAYGLVEKMARSIGTT
ncbi:MAG TPA: Tex-like N-terminal domain-containing protein, partial [Flavobacteriales bacterium]|nr:Tex-like N-terminal domain-containing protein [Flavobacteriales bacterium]